MVDAPQGRADREQELMTETTPTGSYLEAFVNPEDTMLKLIMVVQGEERGIITLDRSQVENLAATLHNIATGMWQCN